jgi:hypothetical protein
MQTELGDLRKTYQTGSSGHWGGIIAGLLLSLLIIGVPVLLAFVVPIRDVWEWLGVGAMFLLMAGGYAALMYLAVLPAIADLGLKVGLHDRGLTIEHGEKRHTLRWEDIDSVRLRVFEVNAAYAGVHGGLIGALVVAAATAARKGRPPTELTIETHEGETVRIPSRVKDSGWLAEKVQEAITELRLPEARAQIRAGREVAFGDLRVSADGLHKKGGDVLPWDEVKKVTVEGGSLIVRNYKGWLAWYTVPLQKVPNAGVLQALVDEHTEVGEEDER